MGFLDMIKNSVVEQFSTGTTVGQMVLSLIVAFLHRFCQDGTVIALVTFPMYNKFKKNRQAHTLHRFGASAPFLIALSCQGVVER